MNKISIKDSIDDILVNWNNEFGNTYPLTKRLIEEKLINSVHINHNGSYSLYRDKEYIGSIVLKFYFGEDEKQIKNAFISFIYVKKEHRNQGYGLRLINEAIEISKENNKKILFLGFDYDNLFSGVFVLDNENIHQFFINRGFNKNYKSFNLITNKRPLIEDDKYIYRTLKNENEKENTLSFIKKNFSYRWYFDCLDTLYNDFVIALDNDKIIGFVRLSSPLNARLTNSVNLYPLYSNLGGIGPLGVDATYRGKGIGINIVKKAMNILFDRDVTDILVDWTGLVDFYKKCGFEKVSNEYIGYQLELD